MAAASCPPAYDWAKNSQGMDPCAVASQLINVCNNIGPLMSIPPKASYHSPTKNNQSTCTCSGPVYALVSACADCQSGTFKPWKDWSHECSNVFEAFPQNTGVMIPTWASHFDIHMDLIYDPVYAQALASLPQPQPTTSTATSTPVSLSTTSDAAPSSSATDTTTDTTANTTTASPFSSPVTSSFTDFTNIPIGHDISTTASRGATASLGTTQLGTNQATDQAASGSLKESNHTGAIAGGVVGGLIFLVAICAFLLWWLQRRRRLRTAPSADYIAAYGTARPPTATGLLDDRASSPLVSHAYSNSRSEKYRDDDKSTSTYLGKPVQQTL